MYEGEIVGKPLTGFKNLIFGMNYDSVVEAGFTCSQDLDPPNCASIGMDFTFLGQPAFIRFETESKLESLLSQANNEFVAGVKQIQIQVRLSPVEVVSTMQKSLGRPFENYDGFGIGNLPLVFWLFENGASIVLDGGQAESASSTSLTYESPATTLESKREFFLMFGLEEFLPELDAKDF
jgi:hypothetical protein